MLNVIMFLWCFWYIFIRCSTNLHVVIFCPSFARWIKLNRMRKVIHNEFILIRHLIRFIIIIVIHNNQPIKYDNLGRHLSLSLYFISLRITFANCDYFWCFFLCARWKMEGNGLMYDVHCTCAIWPASIATLRILLL